ncbi:BrnA antitoxin family protein [Salmonella enterica subsp. diarizonae]|nr:BrnA antitoxin family protein [Salmonella enterica]EDV2893242.1 BrnA antitoxin family protein [Salmonella enterica subsp. diarizonae]
MNAKKHDLKNTWNDPDDAPELDDAFFSGAALYEGEKLVRLGRPKAINPKIRVTFRCSPEVVEAFRATGDGWQTRMNAALKDWLKQHKPEDVKIP